MTKRILCVVVAGADVVADVNWLATWFKNADATDSWPLKQKIHESHPELSEHLKRIGTYRSGGFDGQQTPGRNSLRKQIERRICRKFASRYGQS